VSGKNDILFTGENQLRYREVVPNAEIQLTDSGHFALADKSEEIAKRMHHFLGRVRSASHARRGSRQVDAVALLRRRGVSFKKTVRASEQDRADVAERREAWRHAQKSLGGRLIFLDESWQRPR
jgi:hypothetical protein